jgi:hypothetical protein
MPNATSMNAESGKRKKNLNEFEIDELLLFFAARQ